MMQNGPLDELGVPLSSEAKVAVEPGWEHGGHGW